MNRHFSIILLFAASTLLAQINKMPSELEGVDVEEKLGVQVDGSLEFINESGRPVRLDSFLNQGRPVVLNFVYYECPMLCSRVLNGVTTSMREIPWTPGSEYELLTISISPRETFELAAAKKQGYLSKFDRPAPGWHFLADNKDAAKKLATQVGYGYKWDKSREMYAHASALVLLTPQGKVARYLYGIQFKAFDLRLGLTEASEGKMASGKMEKMLLWCYQYDPNAKSYVMAARNIMRAGGAMTILVLGFSLVKLIRQDKERHS